MKQRIFGILTLALMPLVSAFGQGSQTREIIKFQQTHYLQGEEFRKHNISGKRVRIAVIDAGFQGTDKHPGFEHLFREGRIIATRDFIDGDTTVYHGHWHGTAVLSCIAGIIDGQYLGLAPDAEFLLARTEMYGEIRKEEEYWARAVDWAVENGADIIQSSIGYTYHRYFPEQMNGRTSISAKAALKAAQSGVLLVNSAGNEGGSKWRTLGTPGDADSILTVGALDPLTALPSSFSSVGPTSDGRLKPNVCAPGTVMAFNQDGGVRLVNGTSFSSPLVTGFAACVMEMYPDAPAYEILKIIENSGHLYPYFDYSQGYGVPQASKLFYPDRKSARCNLIIKPDGEFLQIEASNDCIPQNDSPFKSLLYYEILDADHKIKTYGITSLNFYTGTKLRIKDLKPGDAVRMSFNGTITEWRSDK